MNEKKTQEINFENINYILKNTNEWKTRREALLKIKEFSTKENQTFCLENILKIKESITLQVN
jgi:hypothetical protein